MTAKKSFVLSYPRDEHPICYIIKSTHYFYVVMYMQSTKKDTSCMYICMYICVYVGACICNNNKKLKTSWVWEKGSRPGLFKDKKMKRESDVIIY